MVGLEDQEDPEVAVPPYPGPLPRPYREMLGRQGQVQVEVVGTTVVQDG